MIWISPERRKVGPEARHGVPRDQKDDLSTVGRDEAHDDRFHGLEDRH